MSVDSKFYPKVWINNWLKNMWKNSLRLVGVWVKSLSWLQMKAGWGGNLVTNVSKWYNVAVLLHIWLILTKFLEWFKSIKGVWVLFNSLPKYKVTWKHLNSWMGKGKGPFTGVWILICWQFFNICTIEGLPRVALKKLKFFLEKKLGYLRLQFILWWAVAY